MHQTLVYLPPSLFDVAGLGFGWMLIGWGVFSVVLMSWLLWRQGWTADTLSYLPVLLVAAAVIWLLLPRLQVRDVHGNILGLPLRGYGMMVMLGVVAGVSLAVCRAQRAGLDGEVIFSLAFWMFVGGIIGARTFYVVEHWSRLVVLDEAQQIIWGKTLSNVFNVTEGGLVVYGSLIGALPAGLIYLRSCRLPVLPIADLAAPSLLVGLAIGRIGCLLNGCCFGGLCPADSPFASLAVTFPRDATPERDGDRPPALRANSPPYGHQRQLGLLHGIRTAEDDRGRPIVAAVFEPGPTGELHPGEVIAAINGQSVATLDDAKRQWLQSGPAVTITTAEGKQVSWSIGQLPERSLPVHPTQLYSSVNAALLALLLWLAYPFRRRDGQVFLLLLVLYPISRFVLEMIRDDEPGQFGSPLTISQWVSCLAILLAVVLWVYIRRQPQGSGLPAAGGS